MLQFDANPEIIVHPHCAEAGAIGAAMEALRDIDYGIGDRRERMIVAPCEKGASHNPDELRQTVPISDLA